MNEMTSDLNVTQNLHSPACVQAVLRASPRLPGASLWILDVFNLLYVLFSMQKGCDAAASSQTHAALISWHVVANGGKRGNLFPTSLITRHRPARLPASQSGSGVHGHQRKQPSFHPGDLSEPRVGHEHEHGLHADDPQIWTWSPPPLI